MAFVLTWTQPDGKFRCTPASHLCLLTHIWSLGGAMMDTGFARNKWKLCPKPSHKPSQSSLSHSSAGISDRSRHVCLTATFSPPGLILVSMWQWYCKRARAALWAHLGRKPFWIALICKKKTHLFFWDAPANWNLLPSLPPSSARWGAAPTGCQHVQRGFAAAVGSMSRGFKCPASTGRQMKDSMLLFLFHQV